MAGAKIIKKRIQSVRNTRKITRTMEMVSTAKSKKLVDRVHASQPYAQKLQSMMNSLAGLADSIESPYLRKEEHPRKFALLVITANRGLCGGYNTNVLKAARARMAEIRQGGGKVTVYMVGKKGVSFFRFLKEPVEKAYTDIDDAFTFEQAEDIALGFMQAFTDRRFDQIEIISTIYYSSGSQRPGIRQLLPLGLGQKAGADEQGPKGPVIYNPEPESIARQMLPLAVKTAVFGALLEATASEQIYRRIAMKNATDAAGDMLKLLVRTYNRARQASITQELSEIVAGADAL